MKIATTAMHLVHRVGRHLPVGNRAAQKINHVAGIVHACGGNPVLTAVELTREYHRNRAAKIEERRIISISDFIRKQTGGKIPSTLFICGSHLGGVAEDMKNVTDTSYESIPALPHLGGHISGHAGILRVGEVDGITTAAMMGRFHPYQGLSSSETVRLLRALIHLGVRNVVTTCAAGAINSRYEAQDLVLITGCNHFTEKSALDGPQPAIAGPQFYDVTRVFNSSVHERVNAIARRLHITLKQGNYAQNLGPGYEWVQDVNMLAHLKFDLVGMSTVPELLAIAQAIALLTKEGAPPAINVVSFAAVSNPAAGRANFILNHETDVSDNAKAAGKKLRPLLKELVKEFAA